MRYVALAVDFDGTLAHDGRVDEQAEAALARLRSSGRRLILVSGRRMDDLHRVCPQLPLFEIVVAENGGLLYWPATRDEWLLAEAPPRALLDGLAARGVGSIEVGKVVVGTWHPHERAALEVIQELGLEHQLIFNKGAVMILPPTVNKGTGLDAALESLGISPHNVVAVGDAENDHALFRLAECAVAVANALPMVKEHADLITRGDHGAGVVEVIDRLIENDLSDVASRMQRHRIVVGSYQSGDPIAISTLDTTILIAGPSGSGKSTAMLGLLEQLSGDGYQCCTIDPEGDYQEAPYGISIGNWDQAPSVNDVIQLLKWPRNDAIACLLGVPLADRPSYFAALQYALIEMRANIGRPHWLAVDEAHHVLPAWGSVTRALPAKTFSETMLVTVDPSHLAASVLESVDVLIVTGGEACETVRAFCDVLGEPVPALPGAPPADGEVLVWRRHDKAPPRVGRLAPPRRPLRRHRRKYARGSIDVAHRFVFTGPSGQLNEVAANLLQFVEIASAVDDDVWLYHLQRGDITRWFRETIKDDDLVMDARRAEAIAAAGIAESRAIVRRAIEQRYTLPAPPAG